MATQSNISPLPVHRTGRNKEDFEKFLADFKLKATESLALAKVNDEDTEEQQIKLSCFMKELISYLKDPEFHQMLDDFYKKFPGTDTSISIKPAIQGYIDIDEIDQYYDEKTGRISLYCNSNQVTVFFRVLTNVVNAPYKVTG